MSTTGVVSAIAGTSSQARPSSTPSVALPASSTSGWELTVVLGLADRGPPSFQATDAWALFLPRGLPDRGRTLAAPPRYWLGDPKGGRPGWTETTRPGRDRPDVAHRAGSAQSDAPCSEMARSKAARGSHDLGNDSLRYSRGVEPPDRSNAGDRNQACGWSAHDRSQPLPSWSDLVETRGSRSVTRSWLTLEPSSRQIDRSSGVDPRYVEMMRCGRCRTCERTRRDVSRRRGR